MYEKDMDMVEKKPRRSERIKSKTEVEGKVMKGLKNLMYHITQFLVKWYLWMIWQWWEALMPHIIIQIVSKKHGTTHM